MPNIVQEAGYDETCTNLKTCNQPNWIKDGNGNQTDFTYHEESGQLATMTKPAGVNGVRPQVRYTYEQKYAWYKKSSDTIEQADSPIWLLTQESYCKAGAASENGCELEGDEVITTYDYGSGNSNTANNLFLKGITVAADSKVSRTCFSYDNYGNKISETLANAGLASCP